MNTKPTSTRVPGADDVLARANEIYHDIKMAKGHGVPNWQTTHEIHSDSVKAAIMALMEALQAQR